MKKNKLLNGVLVSALALNMGAVAGAVETDLSHDPTVIESNNVIDETMSFSGLTVAEYEQLGDYLANKQGNTFNFSEPEFVTDPEIIDILEKSYAFSQETIPEIGVRSSLLSAEAISNITFNYGVPVSFNLPYTYYCTPYYALMNASGSSAYVGNGLQVKIPNISNYTISAAVKVNGNRWATLPANSNGLVSFSAISIKNSFESAAVYVQGPSGANVNFTVTNT